MAKGPKFKRKELNQPDQFISTTDMILAYCSKQKTLLVCIMAAVVLILFTVLWVRHTQNLKSLGMEALYFQIEQIKADNGPNPEIIIKKLEDILNQFSEGPQKQRAVMLLADQYYENGAYNRAISLYQNILTETSPTMLQYQLASAGVAYSLEGKKRL